MINRQELLHDIKQATEENTGFAMGKIGFSEQCILGYIPFLNSNPIGIKVKAYETMLKYHFEIQTGVFPSDPSFMKEFALFYIKQIQQINILGIMQSAQEIELVKTNEIQAKLIPYQLTEPDRSIPSNDNNCYLSIFKGKRILFISPYADLLKYRAQQDIFEQVWKNTNKKWFSPKQCKAIEIPYSYGNSKLTHQTFNNSIELYNYICGEIDKQEFDVALIAAGALALPIAAYIKNKGKIGVSLGGHLQVLFGINGGRWKNDSFWTEHYINENWIDMPKKYHPENKMNLTDNGAYW
jgi:hypothetical protein